MQDFKWDELRILLAASRTGSFTGAARQLGVDDTTVARRLHAFQSRLGIKLFRRSGDGSLVLTSAGQRAVDHAERMENEMLHLVDAMRLDRSPVHGSVRLTAVPIVANRLLTRHVNEIVNAYPGLELDLVADARNLNLTRREADLALRLARPEKGGMTLWTRRLGTLEYGLYAAKGVGPNAPWITYSEDMSLLPPARWMETRLRSGNQTRAAIRVSDAETAIEAAAAGLGITLLPVIVAKTDSRLFEIPNAEAPPRRDLWLIGHQEQRNARRIRAVVAWLENLFSDGAIGTRFR